MKKITLKAAKQFINKFTEGEKIIHHYRLAYKAYSIADDLYVITVDKYGALQQFEFIAWKNGKYSVHRCLCNTSRPFSECFVSGDLQHIVDYWERPE